MRLYGLIGKSLSHSFSPAYFAQKFVINNISDARYDLFELDEIQQFENLLNNTPQLCGLNVTIPYKEAVIPYLDELDREAQEIGAVNCIQIKRSDNTIKTIGYNTDLYGFEISLKKLTQNKLFPALILGGGGASKAARYFFEREKYDYKVVSRYPQNKNEISYQQIDRAILNQYKIVVNCTPVGMYPQINETPPLPFDWIDETHFVFDMIYNPEETLLMKNAQEKGAKVCNGLEMLQLQADKSWKIWNS